ncbi:MAG TPA: hypothetical protein VLA89_08745 [Gemmatimonadales bacterium]|nr:hypothetical protein [Gemmatimonadales bacterium]
MPHVPETHIEVEGDKPKVERSRQFFSALRAGLKTSEETSLWLQRELEALIQERDSLAAQLEEVTRSRSEIIRNARTLRDDRDSLTRSLEEAREALRWIERKTKHKDEASAGELHSRLYDIGYHAAYALQEKR